MSNMNAKDYTQNVNPLGWEQQQVQQYLAATQRAGSNEPTEPAVYGRAEETLKFICEALNVAVQISDRVAGPRPASAENEAKECELSLDRLLAVSSQRAACLVGLLRTISTKIG